MPKVTDQSALRGAQPGAQNVAIHQPSRGKPAVPQHDREEQDEEPSYPAGDQERSELVATDQPHQERAAHRGGGQADSQDTRARPR